MIKLTDNSKKEATEFLAQFPSPRIVSATTLMSGYVSCIKPIRTICGAEIMCNPDTMRSLKALIGGLK